MNIFQLSSRDLGLLIYLAQNYAIDRMIEITTSNVAKYFSISQQSASRSLRQLSKREFIVWKSSPSGSRVQLTEDGIDLLHQLRFEVELAIHPDISSLSLKGIIFTGLGEGKYYMTREKYVNSFTEELGFKPYPGTLNLRLESEDTNQLDLIRGSFPIIIPGFEEEGRKFGDVLCYPVTIKDKDIKAAILIPSRTHYGRNIIEIVSNINLREYLKLDDGDELCVEYKFHHLVENDSK